MSQLSTARPTKVDRLIDDAKNSVLKQIEAEYGKTKNLRSRREKRAAELTALAVAERAKENIRAEKRVNDHNWR